MCSRLVARAGHRVPLPGHVRGTSTGRYETVRPGLNTLRGDMGVLEAVHGIRGGWHGRHRVMYHDQKFTAALARLCQRRSGVGHRRGLHGGSGPRRVAFRTVQVVRGSPDRQRHGDRVARAVRREHAPRRDGGRSRRG